ALFALEHHRDRLADDHAHATLLGNAIAGLRGLRVAPVETNIVLVRCEAPHAAALAEGLASAGVLASVFDAHTLRFVTHLDVGRADVERAADITCSVWERFERSGAA